MEKQVAELPQVFYLAPRVQNSVSSAGPTVDTLLHMLVLESPGVFHTEPVATGTGQLYVLSSLVG